jgi:hypothetical protein
MLIDEGVEDGSAGAYTLAEYVEETVWAGIRCGADGEWRDDEGIITPWVTTPDGKRVDGLELPLGRRVGTLADIGYGAVARPREREPR